MTKKLAQERFALSRGTPESIETQNGRALVSTAPVESAQALVGTNTDSRRIYSYCDRSNHTMATCRVLVKHMSIGQVKPKHGYPHQFQVAEQ